MKFELTALNGHMNAVCSKVSCASLGICSQLVRSLLVFFSEILFQFICGYNVLKLTLFQLGMQKQKECIVSLLKK